MLRRIITFSFVFSFFAINYLFAQVEPQHEYEKPGYNSGHAYDGILPEESVDLFSGALMISQRDVPVANIKPFEEFSRLISRTYSSKIFRQDSAQVCNPTGSTIPDEFVGLGWKMHFGRLWLMGENHFTLELPDGSRHLMMPDDTLADVYVSKSGWTLRKFPYLAACSPGPNRVCINFPAGQGTAYEDQREGVIVAHAGSWYFYGSPYQDPVEVSTFSYAHDGSSRDQNGLPNGPLWPTQATNKCGNSVSLNWDHNTATPTLNSITLTGPNGTTVSYDYTYENVAGHRLLHTFRTPQGKTYQYDYDVCDASHPCDPVHLSTYELNKLTISSDAVIDTSDQQIKYTYSSANFRISPEILAAACARVVTKRELLKPQGGSDEWSYSYAESDHCPGGVNDHKVTVIDPLGNKREVTYQGYSNCTTSIWDVGTSRRDETFQGSQSLISTESTYGFKIITKQVPDPEVPLAWAQYPKIPVLLQTTKTFSDNGQQSRVSYDDGRVSVDGETLNYDKFGNPDFKIEYNFDGSVLRKTNYEYEHRDGDSDDASMLSELFTHAVSHVTVLDPLGVKVSEVKYIHYNFTGSDYPSFGQVKEEQVWDSVSGQFKTKTYEYDSHRQVSHVSAQSGSGTQNTYIDAGCAPLSVTDDLFAQAGPVFSAGVDYNTWLYTTTTSPNGPQTHYSYDNDNRLKTVTPPSGDTVNINYDNTNRKVTVSTKDSNNTVTSSSTETYDPRGRISKKEITLSSSSVSTQTFEYDALNNPVRQSEKSLTAIPSTFVTKAYDALGRVTSATTADGTTAYSYNGPDMTVTTQSEIGNLITVFRYDVAGRLRSVTEPNGRLTTYEYDLLDHLKSVITNGLPDRIFTYSSRGKLLSETHPESGTTTYTYDDLGRMITNCHQCIGNPIQYSYDLRDRLTYIDYPNHPDVSFYYDGTPVPSIVNQWYGFPKSHLTGMVVGADQGSAYERSATLFWGFNDHDQLRNKTVYLNGTLDDSRVYITYDYDGRGNLASIYYPSGQTIQIPRNQGNAISQIKAQFFTDPSKTLIDTINYNAALLPSEIKYANGIDLSVSPDVRNRPDVINAPNKLFLDYRYNARGLIDQILTSEKGLPVSSRDVAYDLLGRISTFFSDAGTQNYAFDDYGNLRSKTGPINAGPYSYVNNQLTSHSYTAAGSQRDANGRSLIYDDDNRLERVTGTGIDTSYYYDGKGNRVKSVDNLTGEIRFFFYDEAGTLLTESSKPLGDYYRVDKEYVNGPTGTLVSAAYDEVPRLVMATDLLDRVRLTWTLPATCQVAGANIYRSSTSGGPYQLLNTSGPETSGVIDDANVVGCSTYYYQVRTVYTSGSEGKASPEIQHLHTLDSPTADLSNNPSTAVTVPLTVTFTYSGSDTCGGITYHLDYGDGASQDFTSPGSVQHTYTGAGCSNCIATLTVTNRRGAKATDSVLTQIDANLMAFEDFEDGTANGFDIVTGSWVVGSGSYNITPGTGWLLTLGPTTAPCNSCGIRVDAQAVQATGNRNAYIIFDYVNSTTFKFAGMDVKNARWVIGDVISGTRTNRTTFTETLSSATWYSMEIKLDGATKTVQLKGNGKTKCLWVFSTLNSSRIGLATDASQDKFDGFKIAPPSVKAYLNQEDFELPAGAQGYTVAGGAWSIIYSSAAPTAKYQGSIASGGAISLAPVSTFNDGVIEADLIVPANGARGWVIFDYQNPTNFKYAGIDPRGNNWVIGDVVSGTRNNRAVNGGGLSFDTQYHVKVLLEGSKTVTLIYNNTIKVRFSFASLTPRPVGVGTWGGTSHFDNVAIYKEQFEANAGTPPTVPPPTTTPVMPNGPYTSYANPPFYYHLNDHLGTTRVVTDQNGAVRASFEYYPFGEVKLYEGCPAGKQQFTGKLFDNESGLQYFGARYLSNDLTRFTSVDPLGASADPKNPQSWNRYAYSLNSPLNRIDPDGSIDLSFTSLKRDLRKAALNGLGIAIVTTGYAPVPFSSNPSAPWIQEAINSVTLEEQAAVMTVGGGLKAGEAGSFAELRSKGVVGDALTPHHMPQKALGFTSEAEGGALAMQAGEHLQTRTFGWKGAQTATEDVLSFRDALTKDIRDVRSIVGKKYNEGLQDLINYYHKTFPELMKK